MKTQTPVIGTSNHLQDIKQFKVAIITTASNCTAYVIKNTMGAEYGQEADKVRALFEKALNDAYGQKESLF